MQDPSPTLNVSGFGEWIGLRYNFIRESLGLAGTPPGARTQFCGKDITTSAPMQQA